MKCIEISNHYAVYQKPTHSKFVNYTSKTNKDIRFVVTRGGEYEEGELDKGSQKAQMASYEYLRYNVHVTFLSSRIIRFSSIYFT